MRQGRTKTQPQIKDKPDVVPKERRKKLMEELKPCPFCGGKAGAVRRWQSGDGTGKDIWIRCENCGVETIRYDADEDAIAAWNRRAAPENKLLTLEQLRRMDGEPVWIALLNIAKQPTCEVITKICEDGIHTVGTEGSDYASFGLYGKTWIAYASKPEGSDSYA